MSNIKDLPYLLKLLDDDSEIVRMAVKKEMEAYGPSLEQELNKIRVKIKPNQENSLQKIIEKNRQEWTKKLWPSWFSLKEDNAKLELAFAILGDYQNGQNEKPDYY